MTRTVRFRWSDDRVGSDVVFHPAQDIIATCGNFMVEDKVSRKVIIADARDGIVLKELDHGQNYAYGLCFSPDGKTLASGATDGAIRLWDIESGHLNNTLQGHKFGIVSLAFAPSISLIASRCMGLR
jgi:WD40 repeat protein